METDKASVSFDAQDEGYLAKILAGSGEIKVLFRRTMQSVTFAVR